MIKLTKNNPSKTPARFLWATYLLSVKPEDNILEIGCGTGLLAEQICSKLSQGKFTAIDKSPAMITKAQKRNHRFIEAGIANFIITDLLNANFPKMLFDIIVAFNINFFWKDAARELRHIKHLLKSHGSLFIFYQAPFQISIKAAEPIKQKLMENFFTVLDTKFKELSPASAFCIITKVQMKEGAE
jgi:SAM-dependent methyltransferase